MLHSNIGEVISTAPGDQFTQNAAAEAKRCGLPLVIEVFLSSSNEEVEPWDHLPVPLVTLHQLRVVSQLPGHPGVKEYFGLRMDSLDVNLNAAANYFADSNVDDETILAKVADRFEEPWLTQFWILASAAYRLYPWDSSWFARQLGRSQPLHSLSAATVRGAQTAASEWDTPAWRSSRQAVFIKTDNSESHPWVLEDLALRFHLAANRMSEALEVIARNHVKNQNEPIERHIQFQRLEAAGFVSRARAYSFHLRETLLARLLRQEPERPELVSELSDVLRADLVNQELELERLDELDAFGYPRPPEVTGLQKKEKWAVERRTDLTGFKKALSVFETNLGAFLEMYLKEEGGTASEGQFSLTSR
ncbi:hypothetical protein [Frigoribacterium sp. UYMn621]|uniref:hypothetical protein n=1 Tax=Frigoribacterium sp. UYMn621 TaxID=3156343 RepID=UPI00339AD65D